MSFKVSSSLVHPFAAGTTAKVSFKVRLSNRISNRRANVLRRMVAAIEEAANEWVCIQKNSAFRATETRATAVDHTWIKMSFE